MNPVLHLLLTTTNLGLARIRDYGPVYAETNLDRFIVEPWNGLSSLAFLLPAIYWLNRFKGNYSSKVFYVYCSVLLILGGLGSTFYHLFRYYPFFIFMDFVPILILNFSIAVYLWKMLLQKMGIVAIIAFGVLGLKYSIHQLALDTHTQINLDYFITGTFFFLPALLLSFRHKFKGFIYFVYALFFLVLALVCRVVDVKLPIAFLPMGTHFLWHIFCAIGAFYIGQFIIMLDHQTPEEEELIEG